MHTDFLVDYVRRQMSWSRSTFGAGLRTVGVTKHIEKECAEIRAAPTDLEEWIDVMILAYDGYWRHGGQPDDLPWRLREKQDKNFARQWPPIQPEDQPTEHLK